jgi:hypothetical protein
VSRPSGLGHGLQLPNAVDAAADLIPILIAEAREDLRHLHVPADGDMMSYKRESLLKESLPDFGRGDGLQVHLLQLRTLQAQLKERRRLTALLLGTGFNKREDKVRI